MYFERKVYSKLLDWKNNYADKYAVLLEGARRVGKSTVAEEFAKNEYKSYILLDFSIASKEVLSCFDDLSDLNLFFLKLQTLTKKTLFEKESVIIFDEVQLFFKARQAIKHLVRDGRYHYIETGSLISIKKNVKNILIPSEEKRIQVYPLDYEEFCMAVEYNYQLISELFKRKNSIGQNLNRKLMKDLRIYMAVGGMPQAVQGYLEGKNFAQIDDIKREIIALYLADFKKIDSTGKLSAIYKAIPAQLSKNKKRFVVSNALKQRKSVNEDKLIFEIRRLQSH